MVVVVLRAGTRKNPDRVRIERLLKERPLLRARLAHPSQPIWLLAVDGDL
jgi:hypothetical protein